MPIAKQNQPCPFGVGDIVTYDPSERGFLLDVNSNRLEPGRAYRICKVEKDFYIVVEGYSHPGGGLYWTEFKRSKGTINE